MRLGLGLSAFLLLASCNVAGPSLNPTVGQLDEAKSGAAAGDYAAIERMDVSCSAAEAGCAQLRAIRAGACRQVAAYDCAVTEYQSALEAARVRSDPQASPAILELALLEAIHAQRDAGRGDEAERANRHLLEEATAAQDDPATRTAGFYYSANATLFVALQSPAPGGCEAVAQAATDLTRAEAAGTPFARNAEALARAIANAGAARGCAI